MAGLQLPLSIICQICQDPLLNDQGNLEIVTTTCGHVFHKPCIESWLTYGDGKGSSCPNCYTKIRQDCLTKLFLSVDQEDDQADQRLRHLHVENIEFRCATLESLLTEKKRILLTEQRAKNDLLAQVLSLKEELARKEKEHYWQFVSLREEFSKKEKQRYRQFMLLREELNQNEKKYFEQILSSERKEFQLSKLLLSLGEELAQKEKQVQSLTAQINILKIYSLNIDPSNEQEKAIVSPPLSITPAPPTENKGKASRIIINDSHKQASSETVSATQKTTRPSSPQTLQFGPRDTSPCRSLTVLSELLGGAGPTGTSSTASYQAATVVPVTRIPTDLPTSHFLQFGDLTNEEHSPKDDKPLRGLFGGAGASGTSSTASDHPSNEIVSVKRSVSALSSTKLQASNPGHLPTLEGIRKATTNIIGARPRDLPKQECLDFSGGVLPGHGFCI